MTTVSSNQLSFLVQVQDSRLLLELLCFRPSVGDVRRYGRYSRNALRDGASAIKSTSWTHRARTALEHMNW